MSRVRRRRRRGLTLIEILLVLAILVILGAIVGVNVLRGAQRTAYIRAAQAQCDGFKTAIESYSLDVGQSPPSLEALINAPGDLRNPNKWQGPYTDRTSLPDDPWGMPYQYEANEESIKIWSFGPDRQNGTADDIFNS